MLDLSKGNWQEEALKPQGPTCLTLRAWLSPVGGMDRFQPAGFPEIGHVIYDAPRCDGSTEKICIVDSPASMANHLESVCMEGPTGGLHPDLAGLPHVRCVTDKDPVPNGEDTLETLVCTTMTEGHRLASDYFLDGVIEPAWKLNPAGWSGERFRDSLRKDFGVKEVKKDKTYFIWPDTWWNIYETVFKYDPNSLVHGVMFAKEQIKISRFLSAHMEAHGASRVDRSGVKFDRLGKTTSGQPIFAIDEETAHSIIATFILDLALLRSYGTDKKGLKKTQKRLLLDLAVWKVKRLIDKPFRFRTGCHLACSGVAWCDDSDSETGPHSQLKSPKHKSTNLSVDIATSIKNCGLAERNNGHKVYYPSTDLFKPPADEGGAAAVPSEDADELTE
jgi:CRISPR-associated protein Csb1